MLFVSGNIIKNLLVYVAVFSLPSLIDRHSCCEFREFIFSILAASAAADCDENYLIDRSVLMT